MELESVKKKLISIIEISSSFNNRNTLDELLVQIANKSIDILDCERVSLFILDKTNKLLWSKVAIGAGRIEIPYEQGIVGYCARSGKVVNIKDAYINKYFDKSVDLRTGYKTKTILCLPLIALNGEILGVFEAINKKKAVFNDDDIQITQVYCTTIARAIENSKLYQELKTTFYNFLETLASAIDARHPITSGHSKRVTNIAMRIGNAFNLPENDIEKLRIAGLLHDIGKIGISDSILKKHGKLTHDEYNEMKRHPLITYYILRNINFPEGKEDIPFIASHHHERPDGKGYPDGLLSNEIPLLAKILAIADIFEALSAKREYKEPFDLPKIKRILSEEKGKQVDGEVVDKFFTIIDDVFKETKIAQKEISLF